MQRRRERIERWRAERKKKEQEAVKKEAKSGALIQNLTVPQVKNIYKYMFSLF